MITQTDLTPRIQIYRDEQIKLVRYWENEDRIGEWWDMKVEGKIPRCIAKEITAKQYREIEDIFNQPSILEIC